MSGGLQTNNLAGVGPKQMELMAPAGSWAALSAALNAGADSIYFGVGHLNMRARSGVNFSVEELPEIVARCRACGVRSYLAMNTTVFDGELPDVQAVLDAAVEAGVSAVIAADPAVLSAARERGMEVHLSVQANVANTAALRWYAQFVDVVVPARELTLDKIAALCRAVKEEPICAPGGQPIRIELFAHGALCIAVSGQCGMSLALYNKSANRGACYQTCRRRFRVMDDQTGDELVIDNHFVMSPRDLCTIRILDRLADAGVSVLKLEGRGRSADYVATVTRVYREALQALSEGCYDPGHVEDWEHQLKQVFNRGFWHGGYYLGEHMERWAESRDSQAEVTRVFMGLVSNFFARPQVMEFTVKGDRLRTGETLLIIGATTGAVEASITEMRVREQVVDEALKNDVVTIPLPFKARRQDKVYVLRPRQPGQSEEDV